MPAHFLLEYSTQVTTVEDGTSYRVRAYGEERSDGTWIGWLEFHPADVTKPALRTGQETSQPNRVAVEYWASGLEPIYFEGAFERAHPVVPARG
ncbi:MAG: hypothetical protein ABW020_00920 [Candidatus Rokuibacteriota bacterium]